MFEGLVTISSTNALKLVYICIKMYQGILSICKNENINIV